MAPGLDGRASGGDCARIRRIDDFVNMNELAQGLNTHDSSLCFVLYSLTNA